MKGVINDEKIDMISKFYNTDAQMLLSEANIFTALHAMRRGLATRILSVRLSNACIVTKGKKDLSRFFTLYERSFTLVFWKEEWLVGAVGATPST